MERDKNLNVRVTESELTQLRELAERRGISVSDWIRLAIRETHEQAFVPEKQRRTA